MSLNIDVWLAFKSLGMAVIGMIACVAIACACLAAVSALGWLIMTHTILAIWLAGIIWTIMWGVDIYEKQMFIAHQHDYKHFIIV